MSDDHIAIKHVGLVIHIIVFRINFLKSDRITAHHIARQVRVERQRIDGEACDILIHGWVERWFQPDIIVTRQTRRAPIGPVPAVAPITAIGARPHKCCRSNAVAAQPNGNERDTNFNAQC